MCWNGGMCQGKRSASIVGIMAWRYETPVENNGLRDHFTQRIYLDKKKVIQAETQEKNKRRRRH